VLPCLSPCVTIRLLAAVEEADPKLLLLLGRAWELGPKRVGPNLLLASTGGSGRDGAHGSRGSGLWNVPAAQVVAVAKRHFAVNAEGSAEEEADKVSTDYAEKSARSNCREPLIVTMQVKVCCSLHTNSAASHCSSHKYRLGC